MEIRAVSKNTGIPPRKVRLLADMVRGKRVENALDLLRFARTPSARIVSRAVQSAAANAENMYQIASSDLKIIRIYADEAPTMRRFRARSRGRASPILKRSSHITVVVGEQES